MRLMRERGIFAVPTFAIVDYFADHAASPAMAARSGRCSNITPRNSATTGAGVEFAMGSDVGPFPHGTQAPNSF